MGRASQRDNRRDPAQHAVAIAHAVDKAWNTSNHTGRREVALSIVAALSLVGQRDPGGDDLASQFRSQGPAEFTATMRDLYTVFINVRPDLVHLVYPLMAWMFDEPAASLQRAAKHVADAALSEGQLELSGTNRRYDTDLLGVVLTALKSDSARGANAQIYTPAPVADVMSRMLMTGSRPIEEGTRFLDPAVGTGGLFRAAAESMRERGQDPAAVNWYGADIDELAIAACAVNSHLWGLGPRVLLCVTDPLAEADWERRAEAQRTEVLSLTDAVRRDKLMINAVRRVQKLTELAGEHNTADEDTTT
ncbi:N-6 DNA methylase [Saccharopolyspora sp. NPDC002578]